MSDLTVASLRGRKAGTAPKISGGAVITGVATATSFAGNLTGNVTGIATGNVTGDVAGNITGTAGTFSGNVSVGGVITYEDVTSIDSVGIITARDGIKIGAGQSVSAVSGIVTYYGDGSKLSGVESGVVNFVASGTIPNGATVVINTDGTVGIVTLSTSDTPSVGTPVIFDDPGTDAVYMKGSVFDPDTNKVIITYMDNGNSNRGTAIVGTVSGDTISFGTAVVFESAQTGDIVATYDSTNNKVVIAYQDSDNSYTGKAVVGTVSGTSISFGTAVVFDTGNTGSSSIMAAYDSTNQKIIFSYAVGSEGKAIVGTVSGTSISFGTAVVFESANTPFSSLVYDSTNQKVVIGYTDAGNSSHGTAIVGTVSGTSISFGSAVVFNSAGTSYISAAYDSTNGKVVIVYNDSGNSNYGTAIVGTVSGTSISFGSEAVFETANVVYTSATYDSTNDKIVIAYRDIANSNYGTAVVGTVSGTSISFSTPVVFETSQSDYSSAIFDSNSNKVVISYTDLGDSYKGKSVVFGATSQVTNLTAENYIGIAAEAISDTATGRINVVTGTNTGQTGLTTAQKYFVQPNGTLATSAGDPSVVAGTAISDTKILVRKS